MFGEEEEEGLVGCAFHWWGLKADAEDGADEGIVFPAEDFGTAGVGGEFDAEEHGLVIGYWLLGECGMRKSECGMGGVGILGLRFWISGFGGSGGVMKESGKSISWVGGDWVEMGSVRGVCAGTQPPSVVVVLESHGDAGTECLQRQCGKVHVGAAGGVVGVAGREI